MIHAYMLLTYFFLTFCLVVWNLFLFFMRKKNTLNRILNTIFFLKFKLLYFIISIYIKLMEVFFLKFNLIWSLILIKQGFIKIHCVISWCYLYLQVSWFPVNEASLEQILVKNPTQFGVIWSLQGSFKIFEDLLKYSGSWESS